MHSLAARFLLALAALTAGTWVGLGRPSSLTEGGVGALAHEVTRVLPPALRANLSDTVHAPPLPNDASPQVVDASVLPDPTPWPRSNPDESTRRAWLLAEGPAHAPGDNRRIVTFTFDDGPFPETTPDILRILARYHVRGAFFWIGRYLDGPDDRAVTTRAVARQVASAGHLIGNHTHDHASLTLLSHTQAMAQIDDGASSIERVIGRRPLLFRPPYGALDAYDSELLRERGDELVLWSLEAGDMKRGDSAAMADSLRAQIEYAGGGIVLLHDIRLTTIPVLEQLMAWLSAHRYDPRHPDRLGYEVVDLVQYMQETARSPQPFPDRPALEHARGLAWHREHRGAAPRVTSSDGKELAM
jgi:peptidoglycan/xylan/chitin deacetylase (PgdA/CDA1 family)